MSLHGKVIGTAAGFGMKARGEARYEFERYYVPSWGEKGPVLQPPAEYKLADFESFELHLETGEFATAWYKPAREGYATIAYCHGNAGSLDLRRHQLRALADMGFGVMIATYPGFKCDVTHRHVDPSERSCVATGHAMVRELVMVRDIEPEKIIMFGESLGGAVAVRTAYDLQQPGNFLKAHFLKDYPPDKPLQANEYPDRSDYPEEGEDEEYKIPAQADGGKLDGSPVAHANGEEWSPGDPLRLGAVITLNTFDSFVKRAKETFPDMPLNMLMENRFETDKIISSIASPVLLMHGADDTYTPPVHSKRLEQLSGGRATAVIIPGCNHALMKPGTADDFDHGQLGLVLNCAQQFLHAHNLYPDPAPVAVREVALQHRETIHD